MVSAGCAGGALYGFWIVDSMTKDAQARMQKAASALPPREVIPNAPPHVAEALQGKPRPDSRPSAGAGGAALRSVGRG